MAGTLTPTPFQVVLDATGVAAAGAKVYTYVAGTTTAAATYTTAALSAANANPVVADSAGRYTAYLPAGGNFKFIYKTSGDVLIREQDNVLAVPGSAVNLDVEGTVGQAVTAGQVVYLSSAGESSPLTAGLWYLTDSDATPTSTSPQSIGVAVSAIAINTAGTIRLAGLATTASSVVVGSTYYVGATPGAIVTSAPTNSRVVGVANTTSTLILAATAAVVAAIPNPITQDLLFTDATYDIGKVAASRPRDGFFSRNAAVGGTMGIVGVATLTAQPILSSLTASVPVFTDSSKGLVSNALTGTGNVVMSASPTMSGTPIVSSLTASVAVFSNGSKGLVSNAITGTGNVVMSASPTLTGTIGAAAMTLSTPLPVASGGTGLAAITANTVMLGAGTSDVTLLAPGTSGNLMTSNGTVWSSAAPAASPAQGLAVAEGRLTLTSGLPVTTADVSGAANVFYTPYVGNKIGLYSGSAWTNVVFTEITISLSGLTASTPYDIFIYNNSGTATAEALIWTNTTTRATALAYQDGVLSKAGATTRRYIGTVFINSSGAQTEDTVLQRFVWNYYNRVERSLVRVETTNSWTYTTLTYRQANGSTANQVETCVGVSEAMLIVNVLGMAQSDQGDNNITVQVGVDAGGTSANDSTVYGGVEIATYNGTAILATLQTYPAVGWQKWVWVERSTATGTTTWYGDNGGTTQSGMYGSIDA